MQSWSHWRGKAQGAWTRGVDVRKTGKAVVMFGVVVTLLLLYVVFAESFQSLRLRGPVIGFSVFGIVAALVIVQDALTLTRKYEQSQHMESIVANLEALNKALRIQRHDFKNHLQVLSALLEMEEYDEATQYIEKLNVEMQTLSKAVKTAHPAVNALLLAKTSVCEQKRIELELDIRSVIDQLPVPSWQLCLVLANLIDNAIDAIVDSEMSGGRILVHIEEDMFAYRIEVVNNGPPIPSAIRDTLFQPEVTTKGEGRGMGMTIVMKVLDDCGGEIAFRSNAESTIFRIRIPRAAT